MPLLRLFGGDETLIPLCVDYLSPILVALPCCIFVNIWSSFLRNDGAEQLILSENPCSCQRVSPGGESRETHRGNLPAGKRSSTEFPGSSVLCRHQERLQKNAASAAFFDHWAA